MPVKMGMARATKRVIQLKGKTKLLNGLPPSILRVNTRWINKGRDTETTVFSFGDGSHGALGLPFAGDAYEPTKVEGLPSHVSCVTAGHYHSLAVTQGGEVWAWGRNEEGQLGRGLAVPRLLKYCSVQQAASDLTLGSSKHNKHFAKLLDRFCSHLIYVDFLLIRLGQITC
eukprot:Gb_01388 [translate_table: standard]